ncbi:MAG: PilZ domain-containing protein [Bdellovibrionales bacterium]
MEDPEKKYYNPVTAKEKASVLEGLSTAKRPIVMQKGSAEAVKSVILEGSKDEIHIQDVPELRVKNGDEVSFVVLLDSHKYWLRGKVEKRGASLIFDRGVEVSKIQRRENFRAQVLGSSKVTFNIQVYDGQDFKKSFSVLDISYGGCQFEVNGVSIPFTEGCRFIGSIDSPALREPIPVKGALRRVHKNAEHGFMRVGVAFDEHERGVESPLMELIMRCARESQRYQSY